MNDRNNSRGGVDFIGGFFLGIGIGMLAGDVAASTMIGMGVGFLAMALLGRSTKL
ncbi:hypothetical protein [Lentibacillus salicampi]|uniref:hypothetical protein n=1 Tax=Lentibacillus salicampi TaxID=175306 RepID=UPI0014308EDC|nr:hypothetical protein [Lentibacillus salicampi]